MIYEKEHQLYLGSIFTMDKITYAYLETTNYCNLDCSFCNRMM